MNPMGGQNQQSAPGVHDNTVAWKLASLIIASLLFVFVLNRLGFRFVASVSTGVGRGG